MGEILGPILDLGAEAIRRSNRPDYYHPRPEYYPNYPNYPRYRPEYQPVQPPPNVVRPTPAPQPNKIDVPAEVKKNDDFELKGQGVTPATLAQWKNQTKAQADQVLASIRDMIPQDAAEALAQLGGVADKATSGALTVQDLQALAQTMQPKLAPGMRRNANLAFHQLAVLSRLMALLNTAVPGGGPIPTGNQVPMALVPGLPRGTIIILGNGAVLVGVGNLCRTVAVGRGNVAQAVGMTVAIGPPVPDTDAKPVTSGAVLINAEETPVNYNVNDHGAPIPANPARRPKVGRGLRPGRLFRPGPVRRVGRDLQVHPDRRGLEPVQAQLRRDDRQPPEPVRLPLRAR